MGYFLVKVFCVSKCNCFSLKTAIFSFVKQTGPRKLIKEISDKKNLDVLKTLGQNHQGVTRDTFKYNRRKKVVLFFSTLFPYFDHVPQRKHQKYNKAYLVRKKQFSLQNLTIKKRFQVFLRRLYKDVQSEGTFILNFKVLNG